MGSWFVRRTIPRERHSGTAKSAIVALMRQRWNGHPPSWRSPLLLVSGRHVLLLFLPRDDVRLELLVQTRLHLGVGRAAQRLERRQRILAANQLFDVAVQVVFLQPPLLS